MRRVLIAALVGGLIVFVWSALAHMVLPIGQMGLRSLTKEEAVLTALKQSIPDAGLYFYPGFDPATTSSPEQEAAWMERYRTGPTGLLLYRPIGGEPMSLGMLAIEFLSGALAALVVGKALSWMKGSYLNRSLTVGLLGLFAWLAISVSYWNWYGFPVAFIAAEGVDQFVGWTLAGFAMARMIPTCDM